MPEFNAVENTLFIPMLGRIYASEHFPKILYDEKALSLKDVLPKSLVETGSQSQYTLLASASRSANMDRYIRDFLRRKPDGVIAELGCGLETTFYRDDDGHTHWYAVDLPDVMEYRKTLLPEPERQTYFAGDAFSDGWMKAIVITATAEGDAQLKQQIVVQAAVERRKQYNRRLIRERAAFPRCEMIHAQGKERLCHRRSFLHQCLAKLRVIV